MLTRQNTVEAHFSEPELFSESDTGSYLEDVGF